MIVLRCTGKLLARLKTQPLQEPSQSAGLLGDCYANVCNIGPRRLTMLTREDTLLTVLVPGQTLTRIQQGYRSALATLLEQLRWPSDLIEQELAALDEFQISRTQNRSVLGAMNDMKRLTRAWFEKTRDPESLAGLHLWLSETPFGPIQMRTPGLAAREVQAKSRA